jgi:hypothetical protein
MKNDEFKNKLKIMQLKSANKSSSNRNLIKNYSHNKFSLQNSSNNLNSKYLTTDRKQKLNNSTNKICDKDLIYNLDLQNFDNNNHYHNSNKSLHTLNPKKIELIGRNMNPDNMNYFSSNNKMSSKKLFKVNSESNFSKFYKSNDKIGNNYNSVNKNNKSHNKNLTNNPIQNLNSNNTIKIENINNIKNYNSYHIIKKSNSINKKSDSINQFDHFSKKDMNDSMHFNTPISKMKQCAKLDKSARTEPRNFQRKKLSFHNEIDDLNIFGDSNPVKVVVKFRPMNNVENVLSKIYIYLNYSYIVYFIKSLSLNF